MNILFVYSYSNIYTLLSDQQGEHRTVFATFRCEYSKEPVNPLYIFSITKEYKKNILPVLTDDEIFGAFKYSQTMGFINPKVTDILALGRSYEQFYLEIIGRENIDCIVTHNVGYGFQAIAHTIAREKNIDSLITENGYFRPLTMTIERMGVNALSCMKNWKCTDIVSNQQKEIFRIFYEQYKNIPKHNNSSNNVIKELKQRFFYDRFDPEIYHHRWMQRGRKGILNFFRGKASKNQLYDKQFFIFFVSSVYDPQLPIPSLNYINSICESLVEGFKEFKQQYPNVVLVIKEHPLDSKRIILDYIKKINTYQDIFFTAEDSQWLIKHSAGVITINSGTGIEALCEYKPLMCLGESLYNQSDITITIKNPHDHKEILMGLYSLIITVPNKDCIDKFLTHLFYSTQVFIRYDDLTLQFKNLNFFHRAVRLLSQ